jgi:hypothetical protein
MMPINKRNDGWYWGSKGPFESKDKAEEVQRAAYASGYKMSKEDSDELYGMSRSDLKRKLTQIAQRKKAKPDIDTEEELREMQAEAERQRQETASALEAERLKQQEADKAKQPINPDQFAMVLMHKEGGDGGIGAVAVSSDPGVFTDTYGARKKKVMHRNNKMATKKNQKSGPEKLDDFLRNSIRSLDDESFLIELIQHVGTELRKEGQTFAGYTPSNERPYQPPFPQETKRKKRGDDIEEYPTTENTVPVNTGAGELGQSKVPQETALAPPGVDDQRNMNRSVPRKKRKRQPIPTGAFLNPGSESGNNYQDTAVPFTAMQKISTHGNVTANTPKQFSTERPQDLYIERKPRLDPNSDVEQKEFEGNVESIKEEDKSKKGRIYENNKDSNNINSTRIEQYSVHGGSPLQLSSTNMPVGLDSLHRTSDDDITEPDEENTEELQDKEEEIPDDKDVINAEKGGLSQAVAQHKKTQSALQNMVNWLNDI